MLLCPLQQNDTRKRNVTFDSQAKELGAQRSEDYVKPGQSDQDKTTKPSDKLNATRLEMPYTVQPFQHTDKDLKTSMKVKTSTNFDARSESVSFVYNETYCEEDLESDNTAQLEYKGSSPAIVKKMIKTCLTSGLYRYDAQQVEDRTSSNVIFFDEEQVIKQTQELTKQKSSPESFIKGKNLISKTTESVNSGVDKKVGVEKTDREEEKVKDDLLEKGDTNADQFEVHVCEKKNPYFPLVVKRS